MASALGLVKNTAQVLTLFSLSNLWLNRTTSPRPE